MKIAQIAPIWYPIPPKGYGGIELIVHHLTEGLTERGHDVTLFASGDSETKAKLVSVYEKAPCGQIGQVYPDLIHVLEAYEHSDEFDIIHDHSGMIGPTIGSFVPTPVLHTLHGPATENAKRLYKKLSRNGNVYFNAISDYQKACFGDINFIGTIYNAIDTNAYPCSSEKDGYLLFLGRMSPEKGAHVAVEVAQRLGRKLKIVTKMVEEREKKYFEEKVEPILSSDVEFIGEVDIETKAELYRNADCTLFPIQWPEPFGLVMVESMATGTPVVANKNGSVPEVILDGKTGFIVETVDEMVEKVEAACEIDPMVCRKHVEERFSVRRMVEDYEKAYLKVLGKNTLSLHQSYHHQEMNYYEQ